MQNVTEIGSPILDGQIGADVQPISITCARYKLKLPLFLNRFLNICKSFITCVSYATSVRPSVCLSVRLSVTRWHPIKTAEYIVMLSSPHDSPFILVLCISRCSRNSDGVTPCSGAKYKWGIKFARFSTNKSLYLANDTRYRHGSYGRRIGNHTQAFEWHQFQ